MAVKRNTGADWALLAGRIGALNSGLLAHKVWDAIGEEYVWPDGTAPDAESYTNIVFVGPEDMRTADGGRDVEGDIWMSDETSDPGLYLPWHVAFLPAALTPDATPQGTFAQNNPTDIDLTRVTTSGWSNNAGVQNDAVSWDIILGAGTWDLHIWVRKSTNTGIITVEMDGVSIGTVDTYVTPTPIGAKLSITGFTVATSGKKRFNFKAATKNASSSAYVINLMAIEFRRTA